MEKKYTGDWERAKDFIVELNMQTAQEYLEKVKSFMALLEKKYGLG